MTRTGILLCTCEGKIEKRIQLDAFPYVLRTQPDVAHLQTHPHLCLPEGERALRSAIQTHALDRVVVAACPARFQEKRLRAVCVQAGLDPNAFALVDWREGCAWAHRESRELLTGKALDLVQMGLARVTNAGPVTPVRAPIQPRAVVIGGGQAGLSAALALAGRGHQVTLIERETRLGGQARDTDQEDKTLDAVLHHPGIQVLLEASVTASRGTPGAYSLRLTTREHPAPLEIVAGAIVIATGAPRDDAGVLVRLLHLPRDEAGYFLEPHHRLRSEESVERGVFVCGAAHSPVDANTAAWEGRVAAARAAQWLEQGEIVREGWHARVDERLCTGCAQCVTACAFGAIEMQERTSAPVAEQAKGRPIGTTGTRASIDPLLCAACGNCAAECPSKAIDLPGFSDTQILAQIETALAARHNGTPQTLAFACRWSGFAAIELAGARRLPYPVNVRVIELPCASRLDPLHVLFALLHGADGVLVALCPPTECHYGNGNRFAEERLTVLRARLRAHGVDPRRLAVARLMGDDAAAWVAAVEQLHAALRNAETFERVH